ncbi:DUF5134 domain-containing protein [Streptomyces sp. ME02-8801-2C]|uniref:DUF5134 domain-containing protein n=1 Tax=Streptomyces sp. ME02-8801-2C TaxID=3028680 RepID=UPI0029B1C32E|nr:DUF5134 domain-containing protein [Streptomyces sp. ME02-8801-2C]MDX3458650.1 DUF5134 domain-containing protein [Streptomyces sp. ME02-8801-2C]
MGYLALSWSIAAVAALVAAVSAVRMVTSSGEARFAAGGDLLMGLCMAAMALPATAAWYAGYGMWWAVAFGVLGVGGIVLAARRTREGGWRQGRHWTHLVIGSFGMVIMTLAMTSTSSGPVLALSGGHSMAGMPGMEHAAAGQHAHGTQSTEHMAGMESMHGAEMPGMAAHATTAEAAGASSSVWRLVVAALAVYFLMSIAASVWARMRGARGNGSAGGRRRGWGRWLLSMPDTVVVFLASLTVSVWDRARTAERGRHGRRRRLGATPEAALAAHIGMGGTMSAMLLMMAA